MIEQLELLKGDEYFIYLLILAGIGALLIGWNFARMIFGRKKKRGLNFLSLRDKVDLGYVGVLEAAKSFQDITEVLDEVEKGMK